MKTIVSIITVLACNAILTAQTPPPFVADWEGAPDQMKIRANDKNEYAPVHSQEIAADKIPTKNTVVATKKKKKSAKDMKNSGPANKKKRGLKVATK